MAKFKVVVTDHVFESFDIEKEIFASADAELEVRQCESAAELARCLGGVHALLNTYLPGIGKGVFENAPELKVVVRYGIGVDTIDVGEATKHGVVVANVPDYCVEEVADHALAHFLSLARKIVLSHKMVKEGDWSLAYVKPLKGITGMTVGIIGFGRIGRAVAHRIKAFGPTVLFHDPNIPHEVDGCRPAPLDEIYAVCDAIFVQCPGTKETYHLLNQDAFDKMQNKPFIINTARGSIVDTDALVWALENGKIAGAGLDVLEDEKAVVDKNHPLKKRANVVLTPHSAWYSNAAIHKLQRKAAEEVVRVLRGERPRSPANPEVFERK